jgi:hypothetical protein
VFSNPFWIDKITGQTFSPGSLTREQKEKCEYFDSVLEYKVYLMLCRKYGKQYVSRQFEIHLLNGNKFFNPLTWTVDFIVYGLDGVLLFEAKGQWLLHDKAAIADFVKILRLLQINQPQYFASLQLVGDCDWKIPTTNLIVKKL